jgi:hypothetical protein
MFINMENIDKNDLKMIGAKVPTDFAEKFAAHCKKNKYNQRMLFYNLAKWWLDQDETIQWLIYRGKITDAHSLISSAQAAIDDESAAASASANSKRKKNRRRSSKTG